MIQYNKTDIDRILNCLNSLNISGMQNMALVLEVARLLQNGTEVENKEKEKESK